MRRAHLLPGLVALGLAACGGSSVYWTEASPQDPAPSGPRYLRLYKESHFRALGDEFRGGVTMDEFGDRLAGARILFLGDHHDDPTLHQRMLALLEELDRDGRRYDLGLECIGTQDEPAVSAYLAGTLTLDDLLSAARTRWPESWLDGDDVDHAFYRALLHRARSVPNGVFALEPTPRLPLYERDRFMARLVRQRAREHPDRLLVIVVGETHLLGQGQLLRRVDLPHVAVGARLSMTLRGRAASATFLPEHRFAETTSGMLFFLPLDDANGSN